MQQTRMHATHKVYFQKFKPEGMGENNRSSPAEETVDKKLKARISKVTDLNPDKIKADKSGYWVRLPIHIVQASEARRKYWM
jgi:hypothetical protein